MNTDTTTDQAVIDRDAAKVTAAVASLLTDSDVLESISELGASAIDIGGELEFISFDLDLEGTYDAFGPFWTARAADFQSRVDAIVLSPVPAPVDVPTPCPDCAVPALPILMLSMDLTEVKGGYYRCEQHGFFGHFGICATKVA
jgi:hypothetical protein